MGLTIGGKVETQDNMNEPVSSHPVKAPKPGLVSRTPHQIERTNKIKEMLLLTADNPTPRFTTEEIVTKISEWDPEWSVEYAKKGLTLIQGHKRKVIAVQRICQALKADGIPAGFRDRRPGGIAFDKDKFKKAVNKIEFSKMEVSRILGWFRIPDNIAKLSWKNKEEIIQLMSAKRTLEEFNETAKSPPGSQVIH